MPLQIIRHDITKMKVDAIVNTTNEEMVGYSGVDLAIHTIAGKELDEECAKLVPLGLGCAKITKGYKLPCKYVIHTSGPIWYGGLRGESIILRSCYLESLKLAVKQGCKTVAFPLISSGTYGYPKDQVLKFAVQTITEFLLDNELSVYLCVYDRQSYSFSQKLFNDIKAFIGDDYIDTHDDDYYDFYDADEYTISQIGLFEAPKLKEEATRVEPTNSQSLAEYLKHIDKSFQDMLFELIDKKGMTDVECYKRANVDKKTFSKIKCNKNYHPSKPTVVAFAISLKLNLEETQALLATLGFTLSMSNVFDKIIRYFIQNKVYDIFEINQALFEFDQVLLGSF